MNVTGDGGEPFRAVIDRVHGGHDREQNLRGADITGRLVATDMLLARLQGEPIGRASLGVVRNAHEPARHVALVLVARGEIGSVRATEPDGNAEPLGAPDGHVRSHFSGCLEKSERQDVGRHDDERPGGVRLPNELGVIVNRAVRGRVLNEGAENSGAELEGGKIADLNFKPEGPGSGAHDFDSLRMAMVGHEECLAVGRRRMAKGHRFRRGRGFVEQRGIGNVESGQVRHHRLEIDERFEAALRQLRLVWCVSGVPARVLQDIALDHRWRDRVVITRAEEGTRHLVLAGNGAQFGQRFRLRYALRQLELTLETNVFGNRRID